MTGILLRLTLVLVRVLIRLYPPAYRRHVGKEIVADYRERIGEFAGGSALGAAALLLRSVVDLVVSALSEWARPSLRAGVELGGSRSGGRIRRWLDVFGMDVRFACRWLSHRPGFTAVAVVTLALGIGADVVFFSAVNTVLVRPLSLGDPDRLVAVWESSEPEGFDRGPVSPADLFAWREQVDGFDDAAGYGTGVATVAGGESSEVVAAAFVMGNFFEVAGVRMVSGRAYTMEETWRGAAPVVVISEGLWARRFGRDPAVVGSTLVVDEEAREVIGIAPASLAFPDAGTDVWLPIGWDRTAPSRAWFREERFLLVIARLRDDVAVETANEQLQAVVERLRQRDPAAYAGVVAGLTPLQEHLTGELRLPLLVLLGASGLILLLACANIASLLLGRGSGRLHEIAMREALGAGRSRIARQLLTESLVLAGCGGLAGLGTAAIGVRVLRLLHPPESWRLEGLVIDTQVLVFTLSVTLLTALLFGLAPALQGAASSMMSAAGSGGRSTGGRRGRQARQLLVASEIALTVLLVTSAGLLLRSFVALRQVDPGLRVEHRVTAFIVLPPRYASDGRILSFIDEMVTTTQRIGEVRAVTYASRLPFSGTTVTPGGFAIEGRPDRLMEPVGTRLVAPNYFDVLEVPLLAGRGVADTDDPGTERVILINERMARLLFGGAHNAVGRRITWDENPGAASRWYRIAGVVGNEHQNGLRAAPPMEIFMPFRQLPSRRVHLIVHARGDASALASPLRAALARVDPMLGLGTIQPLETIYAALLGRERLLFALIGAFAVVALVVASVGVYGLLAEAVVRRTREIGIRIALGAASRDIAVMVLKHGLALSAAGFLAGLVAAIAASRLLTSLLFGVTPADAVTYLATIAILAAVSVTACAIPALRAARLEPGVALRHD